MKSLLLRVSLDERVSLCDPSSAVTNAEEMLEFELGELPIEGQPLTTSAYDLRGELPSVISFEMVEGEEGV